MMAPGWQCARCMFHFARLHSRSSSFCGKRLIHLNFSSHSIHSLQCNSFAILAIYIPHREIETITQQANQSDETRTFPSKRRASFEILSDLCSVGTICAIDTLVECTIPIVDVIDVSADLCSPTRKLFALKKKNNKGK